MDGGLILMGSAFLVIACVVIGVGVLMGRRRGALDDRVESLSASLSGGGGSYQSAEASRRSRSSQSGSLNLINLGESKEGLGARIIQAGFYKRTSIVMFYIFRVVLMVMPVVLALFAWQVRLIGSFEYALVGGILAGVIGTLAPSFWLDFRKSGRQTNLRRALPDALDVIIICVEAGLSVPSAINRVAKELRTAHPLLAAEMAIVEREIQMGASSGEALKSLANRFDLAEIRGLASVIQQTERFGASIVNALRVHSETLRQKRFQAAEEKAQKAAVKLVFPTILCIFPALFIVLAGPAVQRVFQMLDLMGV